MKITKIWLTSDAVHVLSDDGREGFELIADYARLRNAPREALEDYNFDSFGIHWPQLDEDLAFENFFDHKPKTNLYRMFMAHPEINVSALARRLGISQSLMAQYIGGTKKLSKERSDMIISELRAIGNELACL